MQTGLLLGVLGMGFFTYLCNVTKDFVLDAMSRAETIETLRERYVCPTLPAPRSP